MQYVYHNLFSKFWFGILFTIFFPRFFWSLFTKLSQKQRLRQWSIIKGFCWRKSNLSVYTSKRIDFVFLLLIYWAQYCGTISMFVLATYTDFKPLIIHLAASTWLKSGTCCLFGMRNTMSQWRGCGEWHHQLIPQWSRDSSVYFCILFLEYSGSFWEGFCSLLDTSVCPHKSWQNIYFPCNFFIQ